ncbi:MAG TPA: sulfurtransferase [Acidimicrobiia bacterium]|nr:sulfurtransferase [Acidimicrobiia bacterium]
MAAGRQARTTPIRVDGMTPARVDPLVSPEWLLDRAGDPDLVVVEVSFYQPDTAAYFSGHIDGAHYAYWKDLLWHELDREFARPTVLADRLGALGVGDETTLVLVGDPVQFATYAYWVLAMSGFEERTAVLDGGRETWARRAYPQTDDRPVAVRRTPTPGRADDTCRIGREGVLAGLEDPRRVLIDLRSAEEYSGERVAPLTAPFDHGAERRGHIPGARHLPREKLLTEEGTFKSPDELWAEFRQVGVSDDHEIVTSCRLSHRASLGWFVLTRLLGREHVRVYDGSWTEWGSIVGYPVER